MLRVFIPNDSAALSVGADALAAAIRDEAKRRSLEIRIVRNGTRGMLWLEPLVEIETKQGRIAYGPVKPEDVPGLFDADFLHGGAHQLGHGQTSEIPYLAKQDRLIFSRCGLENPLDLDAYMSMGGMSGLKAALAGDSAAIIGEIKRSGLRGRGGAGFPAHIKWATVANTGTKADGKYVCCNADEGDSGTFADRILMEGDPFLLLEGMIIAGIASGAQIGYIYVRSEYPHAIACLRRAIAVLGENGYLGEDIVGSDHSFDIHVRVGAGSYVCGEESAMLNSLEGKRGEVRFKPPVPAISGLFGKPSLIHNVLTLASVPVIMAQGGAAFASIGSGKSLGSQPFQLAGDIAKGGLVEKAFGISLRELLYDFGGGSKSGKPVRAIQIGGPLGAYLSTAELDTAMDYESLASVGGMLGHGGIVVFNDSVDMAQQARFAMEFCRIESCGKCTPCRIGAARGVETLDKIIAKENPGQNLDILDDLCELMEDGSLCAMGGLTPMPVRSALQRFPEDF